MNLFILLLGFAFGATSFAQNNLISNPGFESALNDWINLGNSVNASSPVKSGTGAAKIGIGSGGIRQIISLKPNIDYVLSGFSRVGAAGEIGYYGVTFKDSKGGEIVNFQSKITGTTYSQQTLTFKSPASFASADVWGWKGAGASHLYLDNLVLTESTNSTTPPVATACSGMGSITLEKWDDVSGSAVSDLSLSTKHSSTATINTFEITNLGDIYGTRISGYVCPPVSGNYTFYISGDDNVKLSLSSSDSPAGLRQIAAHSAFTSFREIDKYSSQKSAPIALTAGKKYFIEVFHKEGAGGDHVSVGWDMPDGKREMPLPSSRIAPKSTVDVVTPPAPPTSVVSCSSEGKITLEKIDNISTSNPLDLTNKLPTAVSQRTIFEAPTDVGSNFGHRMSGFICVPSTGDYTFYIAGDDQVSLFLSTDLSPVNKKRIAYHGEWTAAREYTKFPTQTSAPVRLEAGKKYYIEALQVEGAGGDNLSVGWKHPNGTMERPIPGSRLTSNSAVKPPTTTPLPPTEPTTPAIPVEPTPTTVSGTGPTKEDSFNEDSISYSGPIVITKGGIYRGNWQSTNSDIPAVEIKTGEPVIIENSVIRGAGFLVKSWYHDANITIRNSRGYGIRPTPYTEYPKTRRFLTVDTFKNVVVENNYMESTAGISIKLEYKGNRTPSESIKVRYNKVKNIDGRHYTGQTHSQFIQLQFDGEVPGVDVSWNQIINEPGSSRVEDNMNIFNAKGTAVSPMIISHNYIHGAYPLIGDAGYSGGGILSDSDAYPDKATRHLHILNNQVVNSHNYSFGIAGGNNILMKGNRAISSEYLDDNRLFISIFPKNNANGYWAKDYYKKGSTFNNLMDSNVLGISAWYKRIFDPTQIIDAENRNMIHLLNGTGVITLEMQKNEYKIFSDKVKAHGKHIGPK